MKKFFKWVGIIFVVVVLINAVANNGDDKKEVSTNNTESTETSAKPEPAKEEPKKEESVTKANYEKIKQGDVTTGKGGMTYDQVVAILGEPDDKMESETDISGQKYKTLMCNWTTLDFESISVTFTNNGVSHKMWMD